MGFISKVELKKQLQKLGVKVEGNYIKKSDVEKILAGPVFDIKTKKEFLTDLKSAKDKAIKTLNNLLEKSPDPSWEGLENELFDVGTEWHNDTTPEKKLKGKSPDQAYEELIRKPTPSEVEKFIKMAKKEVPDASVDLLKKYAVVRYWEQTKNDLEYQLGY